LAKKVQSKIADGDIRNAIRILTSDDTIAPKNEETLRILKEKHPFPDVKETSLNFNDSLNFDFKISDKEIKDAIFSFNPGSSGGLDSLRPRHLKDLLGNGERFMSSNFLCSIKNFIIHLFHGLVPKEIAPIFYGENLCAFNKKSGGIRPIAVGLCLRRLAAKIICFKIRDKLKNIFQPNQLGFGTKCGAEVVTHAMRRYLQFSHNSDKVIFKIDYQNAFIMVNRNTILERVKDHLPEYLNFISKCYGEQSYLSFNEHNIISQRGVQQDDLLYSVWPFI